MSLFKRLALMAVALVMGLGAITAAPAQAIIGGEDATGDNRVVYVYLYQGPVLSGCTGVPIAPRVVLTAAHCTTSDFGSGNFRFSPENVFVSQPGANMRTSSGIPVQQIIYPECNQVTSRSMLSCDLAALVLASPLTSVGIARLGTDTELQAAMASRAEVTALGYGRSQYNYFGTLTPRKVSLNVSRPNANIQQSVLGAQFGAPGWFPVDTVGKGTCFGDSGGPLVQVINGQSVLLGLTSWGFYCAGDPDNTTPWGWFTNVTAGGLYGKAISEALAAAARS